VPYLLRQPKQGAVQPQRAFLVQLHHLSQQAAGRLDLAGRVTGADRGQGRDRRVAAERDPRLSPCMGGNADGAADIVGDPAQLVPARPGAGCSVAEDGRDLQDEPRRDHEAAQRARRHGAFLGVRRPNSRAAACRYLPSWFSLRRPFRCVPIRLATATFFLMSYGPVRPCFGWFGWPVCIRFSCHFPKLTSAICQSGLQ